MKSHLKLIKALNETAVRLEAPKSCYEWGHMGKCNAGQLIQTMTGRTGYEIVEAAEFEMDEWSEHAKDYCEGTGGKVSVIFDTMKSFGFDHEAIMRLENLSDRNVLGNLPGGFRYLRRNDPKDVAAYMRSLADLLNKKAA